MLAQAPSRAAALGQSWGRTVDSMLVEWDMHNDHYEKLFWHLYDNVFKQDTCSSAMHVDLDSNSEGLDKFGLYWKAIFGY